MGRKNKKKSTPASVSLSPPLSEPSPASAEPAQPPPALSRLDETPIIEVDSFEEKIRRVLGDIHHDYERSLWLVPDRHNVTLLRLAKFFKVAYVLGKSSMDREKEEARAEGVLEGKNAEQLKWIGDGHVPGKECMANRNERTSIAVETVPEPPLPNTLPSTTTSTNPLEKPKSLSWADEMEDIPIHPITTTKPTASPRRNLSVLRSESQKPFASLRRCTQVTSHARHHHSSAMKYPFSMLPTRRHTQARQFTCHSEKKIPPSHSHKPPSRSRYDWSSSLLVLSDLARALGDMGWKPPDFFSHAF
jgi:hypothetical protein